MVSRIILFSSVLFLAAAVQSSFRSSRHFLAHKNVAHHETTAQTDEVVGDKPLHSGLSLLSSSTSAVLPEPPSNYGGTGSVPGAAGGPVNLVGVSAASMMAKFGTPAAAPAPTLAAGPAPMPNWSQGDWHQFIGGTGSVDKYMAQYSGGAAPGTGTGTAADFIAKAGGTPQGSVNLLGAPAPAGLVGVTVADMMAKYGGAPVPAAAAAPAAGPAPMPDWSQGDWHQFIGGTGSVDHYMGQYSGGAAPGTGTGTAADFIAKAGGTPQGSVNLLGAPAPAGLVGVTVAEMMAKYGGAPVPAPAASAAPAAGPAPMPDWSQGDWHSFIGGTGSAAQYMAQYSGGAAPNTGTGTVADYMGTAGAPAPQAPGGGPPVNLVGVGAADMMAKYSGAPAPAAPAAAAPAGPAPMPDWGNLANYMAAAGGPAPQAPGGVGPPVNLVALGAGAAIPAAPAAAAPAAPVPDWGQGDWHKYFGGTGTAAEYMAKYNGPAPVNLASGVPGPAAAAAPAAAGPPPMPDWGKGGWTQFIGGTGDVGHYMGTGAAPPPAPGVAPAPGAPVNMVGVSVGDMIAKYSNGGGLAPAPPPAAPTAAPGAAYLNFGGGAPAPYRPPPPPTGSAPLQDWSQGSWHSYIGGTGSAIGVAQQYTGPGAPAAPAAVAFSGAAPAPGSGVYVPPAAPGSPTGGKDYGHGDWEKYFGGGIGTNPPIDYFAKYAFGTGSGLDTLMTPTEKPPELGIYSGMKPSVLWVYAPPAPPPAAPAPLPQGPEYKAPPEKCASCTW